MLGVAGNAAHAGARAAARAGDAAAGRRGRGAGAARGGHRGGADRRGRARPSAWSSGWRCRWCWSTSSTCRASAGRFSSACRALFLAQIVGRGDRRPRRSPGSTRPGARRELVVLHEERVSDAERRPLGGSMPAAHVSRCAAPSTPLRLGAATRRSAAAAWREATAGYRFAFPRDHAAIPTTRSSGGTTPATSPTADGPAVRLPGDVLPRRRGSGAGQPVAMGRARPLHGALAVTRPGRRRYRFDERLNRGGPGLSGAATDRYGSGTRTGEPGSTREGRHMLTASPSAQAGVDARPRRRARPPVVHGVGRHQPEGRAGRQRVALLLAHADAARAARSPSTASGSR